MKKIIYLICLYPFLVFAGPVYYDKDISPAAEKLFETFKKDEKSNNKAFNGYKKILSLYLNVCAADDFKKNSKDMKAEDATQFIVLAMSFGACEIYAVDYYNLTPDYLRYLESPELDNAAEKIKKNIDKHSKSMNDCLDYIHDELSVAMKKTSPKLSKIYKTAKFLEASVRMFSNSKDKVEKKKPKEEVEDLMLMKEIISRRINEVEDGLAPDDFPKTLSQISTDLRAYYRLSNCPDDFAYAFVDYLAAIDEMAELAMDRPKDVSPEDAFATVLIWTLAGGNPLAPALLNENANAEWQRKGKELQKKLADAENNLNKIAIKYGLRL